MARNKPGSESAHRGWLFSRATAPGVARLVSLLATDGAHHGRRVLPAGWVQEMARPSRVSADTGMQLSRLMIEDLPALGAGDDNGSQFWIFPEQQIAIINIVNPQGLSPPGLSALLLRALPPG